VNPAFADAAYLPPSTLVPGANFIRIQSVVSIEPGSVTFVDFSGRETSLTANYIVIATGTSYSCNLIKVRTFKIFIL
jgi:hypothetical protein